MSDDKLSFKTFAMDALSTKGLNRGQVQAALRTAGYMDSIESAVYAGESSSSGSIYSITYKDPDEENGIGNGKVYVKEVNGRLEAEY